MGVGTVRGWGGGGEKPYGTVNKGPQLHLVEIYRKIPFKNNSLLHRDEGRGGARNTFGSVAKQH